MHGGGGGFLETSTKQKPKQTSSQAVVPCTIAMLLSAKYDNVDAAFKIGASVVNQVTLVAMIKTVTESAANIQYHFCDNLTNDGMADRSLLTGKSWFSNPNDPKKAEILSGCREGIFVRVTGIIKSSNEGSRFILVSNIRPVVDFNEISFHLLHAAFFINFNNGVSSDGLLGHLKVNDENAFFDSSFNNNHGLTGNNKLVYSIVNAETDASGMHIDVIKSKLPNLSEAAIAAALEFLSSEGHIYSTIDSDHFKSTEFN